MQKFNTHRFHFMLLQDLVQLLPLFVVEVEVLALWDGLGAHQLGDGRPVAAILEKSCTQTCSDSAKNTITYAYTETHQRRTTSSYFFQLPATAWPLSAEKWSIGNGLTLNGCLRWPPSEQRGVSPTKNKKFCSCETWVRLPLLETSVISFEQLSVFTTASYVSATSLHFCCPFIAFFKKNKKNKKRERKRERSVRKRNSMQ